MGSSLLDSIIDEILEEKVVSSRGKRNQRAVKRKIKGWPIKKRERKRFSGKIIYEFIVLK
ncbi:MAG TPA: hypothetical protein P5105_05620 [Victivallales bacterium]|nr:hypothetical protein [Victivallales bacterium]HRR28081.1 hypothetical protein [Victivallales bacterium]HRU01728.1 hypothetical protein [Victivallales bacterium]